ncbi:MAG: M15 family metallopeptidase [Clostridia bacterium]|nr:M15 family metallopeptidase [Clostridia bacterium]
MNRRPSGRKIYAALILVFLILGVCGIFTYAHSLNFFRTENSGASGNVTADEGNPSYQLLVDGESLSLEGLFNSREVLFGRWDNGVPGEDRVNIEIVPQEKRLIIKKNDSTISLQFLNALVRREGNGIALQHSGSARAVFVISAPEVNRADPYSIEVATTGASKERACFVLHLERQGGSTLIKGLEEFGEKKRADEYLILVNKENLLDRNFVPGDLTVLPNNPKLYQRAREIKVRKGIIDDLILMFQQAKKEGVSGFFVVSAYRSYDYQSGLFQRKVRQLGNREKASQVVAMPGTSEHQTGLALDISAVGKGLVESFAETPQGRWLNRNSWKYGFILRYPKEKNHITNIIYEPWHYRYVGYPHSKIIFRRGLCLEEYLSNMQKYGYYAVASGSFTYLVLLDHEDGGIYLLKAGKGAA